MSMKTCKDCGAEVSKSAKICPNCGRKLKHPFLTFLLIVLVIIIGIAIAMGGETDTNTTNSNSSSTVQEEKGMTMEKFNKIKTGMTYKEVVKIAGEEGTLSTESSYGSQSMKIYYWYASNGISNATVSFTNGKVSGKSQIGLK